jgi:flagellar biosynthesis protein FliR
MDGFLREIAGLLTYQQELMFFGLILSRTMPIVIQTPFLGGKLVPPELKMGLGILLTLIIWPVARGALKEPLPSDFVPFFGLLMKEIFIGFVIGFVTSHVFTIMEVAGRLIDTARGTSMAEVMVPESGQRATPFGDLYYQMLVVIFLAMGAHNIFFEAFFFSFSTIPLAQNIPMGAEMLPLVEYMIELTGYILLAAVLLSAPVMAAVLITDVVFGILNRVAPQLNAYFMAMPVKAMGGVILAIVVMDTFVGRMSDYVVWSLHTVEKSLTLLVR